MPLVNYLCKDCGHKEEKLLRPGKITGSIECLKCKGNSIKQMGTPASVSKITVDNGWQAKSVEIMPDILELHQERGKKQDRGPV